MSIFHSALPYPRLHCTAMTMLKRALCSRRSSCAGADRGAWRGTLQRRLDAPWAPAGAHLCTANMWTSFSMCPLMHVISGAVAPCLSSAYSWALQLLHTQLPSFQAIPAAVKKRKFPPRIGADLLTSACLDCIYVVKIESVTPPSCARSWSCWRTMSSCRPTRGRRCCGLWAATPSGTPGTTGDMTRPCLPGHERLKAQCGQRCSLATGDSMAG